MWGGQSIIIHSTRVLSCYSRREGKGREDKTSEIPKRTRKVKESRGGGGKVERPTTIHTCPFGQATKKKREQAGEKKKNGAETVTINERAKRTGEAQSPEP